VTAAPADPVAKLLYDARIARAGAGIALDESNMGEMARLNKKARDLIAEAEKLDRKHQSIAWHTELEGALKEEGEPEE
jgi:hypothetical protein